MFAEDTFRKWIDELLSDGFVDTFRYLHPDDTSAFTCWCSRTNARQNNYGSRIDYIMVDNELAKYLEKADVHSDIFGSDHCPISASFHTLFPVPAERAPVEAAKFYKEFYGKQTNLKAFLSRSDGIISSNGFSSQNSFDILTKSQTKTKRNVPSGAKQSSIASFFVKKPKTDNISIQSEKCTKVELKSNIDVTSKKCLFDNLEQHKDKTFSEINQDASKKWKNLMTTPNTPSCAGHNELCVLRTVRKNGLNQGRQFWSCPRGVGQANDPNANCKYFAWVKKKS